MRNQIQSIGTPRKMNGLGSLAPEDGAGLDFMGMFDSNVELFGQSIPVWMLGAGGLLVVMVMMSGGE